MSEVRAINDVRGMEKASQRTVDLNRRAGNSFNIHTQRYNKNYLIVYYLHRHLQDSVDNIKLLVNMSPFSVTDNMQTQYLVIEYPASVSFSPFSPDFTIPKRNEPFKPGLQLIIVLIN